MPLKQVMSAGQFNIAKTVDYVGVKVTEVNAGPPSYHYGEEPAKRSPLKHKQTKKRPQSTSKKAKQQIKQPESESP